MLSDLTATGVADVDQYLVRLGVVDRRITLHTNSLVGQGTRKGFGVRDHLELWNAESWSSYIGEKQEQYDDLAERAFTAEQKKQ